MQSDDDLVPIESDEMVAAVGRETVLQAIEFFTEGLDLPLPPLPARFVDELRVLGEGQLGTRTDAPALDDVEALLEELRQGRRSPYLLLGTGGHGIASTTVCYHLVLGGLALFLQLRLVALGSDWPVMRERIVHAFALVRALIEAGAGSGPDGLVVVETDIGESRIGRFRHDGTLDLRADPAPLLRALQRLPRAA
jgi:hypothetical protein